MISTTQTAEIEDLGLVIPTLGGMVRGRTFNVYIPVDTTLAILGAVAGEIVTLCDGAGQMWSIRIDEEEAAFSSPDRAFRVRKDMLW